VTVICCSDPGNTGQFCITDIDECSDNPCTDAHRTVCINSLGSYSCDCEDGFELTSNETCVGKYCWNIYWEAFCFRELYKNIACKLYPNSKLINDILSILLKHYAMNHVETTTGVHDVFEHIS
jgi:hypothetical protein